MSSTSPREEAATEAARTNFDFQQQLTNTALPGLKATLDSLQQQLGGGNMLNQDVHKTFESARGELQRGYETSLGANENLIRQQAMQSGEVYQPSQVSDTISTQARMMDQQRIAGLRNLQFQEAQAGLGQYNQLMNMLGQGSGAAFNIGKGFSSVQGGAIGGMSNSNPWGSAIGGAAAGAAAGSQIYPGWGTAIGAVAGGALGYFGGGG